MPETRNQKSEKMNQPIKDWKKTNWNEAATGDPMTAVRDGIRKNAREC